MLFTDTVGFIQKLPTQIVAAFRATLEEINDAHVLLHVVDATHPQARAQMEAVEDTLAELEVEQLPVVIALNKIDRLSELAREALRSGDYAAPAVPVSALTGEGMEELLIAVEAAAEKYMMPLRVHLPYTRGDLLSLFHERGQVENEEHGPDGIDIFGRLPRRLRPAFAAYEVSGNP